MLNRKSIVSSPGAQHLGRQVLEVRNTSTQGKDDKICTMKNFQHIVVNAYLENLQDEVYTLANAH